MRIEIDDLINTLKSKNYNVFTNGDYNLNIVGIRSTSSIPNKFDDWLTMFYKVNNKWTLHTWDITTDPGLPWLLAPMNKDGTAILKEGQYNSYALDLHNGKYLALCQRIGPVTVYRDGNKNGVLDFDETSLQTGFFGINIHRAALWGLTPIVNKHSAGCQVFQSSKDFDLFISICTTASKIYGNRFTYTLLNQKDFGR